MSIDVFACKMNVCFQINFIESIVLNSHKQTNKQTRFMSNVTNDEEHVCHLSLVDTEHENMM